MRGCFTRAWCCASLCVAALAGPVCGTEAPRADAVADADETVPAGLSERQIVVHVLNRMAFGPRPGQVDQLVETGWQQWVNAQLRARGRVEDEASDHVGTLS